MKSALFTNFSSELFTGYYDGKGRTFEPGESRYMPDYIARHFAKHLANRELLRRGPDGETLIPNGEKYTSPKKPDEVPVFKALFDKAYEDVIEDASDEELGSDQDDLNALIDSADKNHRKLKANAAKPEKGTAAPKDDEEEFEGDPDDEEE